MRQIAIYGESVIGKSTTMQNRTAALSSMGNKILLVECHPKADFIRMLPGGQNQKKLYKKSL